MVVWWLVGGLCVLILYFFLKVGEAVDYSLLAGIDIQNHTITVGIVDYMHRYSVFVVFLFVLAATLDLTLNLFLSDVFFDGIVQKVTIC